MLAQASLATFAFTDRGTKSNRAHDFSRSEIGIGPQKHVEIIRDVRPAEIHLIGPVQAMSKLPLIVSLRKRQHGIDPISNCGDSHLYQVMALGIS